MNTRSAIPLHELEAPGLERTRLSPTALILMFPLLAVLLTLVALLVVYHSFSRKSSVPRLSQGTTDLKISFRKMHL